MIAPRGVGYCLVVKKIKSFVKEEYIWIICFGFLVAISYLIVYIRLSKKVIEKILIIK